MNDLYYKGTFTSIPGTWDELTAKQYVRIINVLLLKKGTLQEKQIQLLKILTGFTWFGMARILDWWRYNPRRFQMLNIKKLVRRMPDEGGSLARVLDRTERLATAAEELTAFLFQSCTLSRNIMPRVGRYYGPADYLDNLRMGEFVYAENFFGAWKAKNEITALNQLISVLYRPLQFRYLFGGHRRTSDPRIPFDPVECARNISTIAAWPLEKRIAIATMYGSMRQRLIDENPRVFTDSGGSEDSSPYGLWSVMRQVAKQGHFGKFSDIEQSYISTILMELNESIIEAERQEERLDAMHNT